MKREARTTSEADKGKSSRSPRRANQWLRDSSASTATHLLHMQQALGNRSVRRLMASPHRGIQRMIVEETDDEGNTYFYSTLRSTQRFATEKDALAFENALSQEQREATGRAKMSTLYSFATNKPGTAFGTLPGPHTAGFAAVETGLDQAYDQRSLLDIFLEQVPPPDAFENLVEDEKGEGIWDNNRDAVSGNLNRAADSYRVLYHATAEALHADPWGNQNLRTQVMSLMNMHPYATTGWKTRSKVKASSSAGKGETRDIMDDRNWDTPRGLKNKGNIADYKQTRQLLGEVDDDFEPGSSSSSEELEAVDMEFSSSQELAAVDMEFSGSQELAAVDMEFSGSGEFE